MTVWPQIKHWENKIALTRRPLDKVTVILENIYSQIKALPLICIDICSRYFIGNIVKLYQVMACWRQQAIIRFNFDLVTFNGRVSKEVRPFWFNLSEQWVPWIS